MTRWQSKTPMTWTKLHPFFFLFLLRVLLSSTLFLLALPCSEETHTDTWKSVSQKCRGSFFSTLPISPLSIVKPSLLSSPTPSLTPLSLLSNSIITASLFPSSSLLPLLLLPFLSEPFPSAHSTPPKPKAKKEKKKKKQQRNQEMRKGRRRRLIVARVVVLKIQSIQAVNFSLKSLTGGGSSLSSSRCSLLCLGSEFAKAPSWPWTFAARLLFFSFSISIIWRGLEMKI